MCLGTPVLSDTLPSSPGRAPPSSRPPGALAGAAENVPLAGGTWATGPWLNTPGLGPRPLRPSRDPEFSAPRKPSRSASWSGQAEGLKAAGGQRLDRDTREQFRLAEEKERNVLTWKYVKCEALALSKATALGSGGAGLSAFPPPATPPAAFICLSPRTVTKTSL